MTRYMTVREHNEHMARRDRIQAAIVDAQAHRDSRQGVVEVGSGLAPAWVIFEQETAWRAVNDERARLGKGPVPIAEVQRVESMAAGHVDYTAKFSLYCADLVLKDAAADVRF